MAKNDIKPGEEFLGQGFIAPLKQSPTGEFEFKSGLDLVRESLKAIFSTRAKIKNSNAFAAGERFMRGSFGNKAHQIRHENITDETVALLEANYVDAAELWEPRAIITNITTKTNETANKIETFVNFRLVGVNAEGNLVIVRDQNSNVTFRDF